MSERWYTTPRFRRIVLTLAWIALIAQGVDAVFFKDNDFQWHRWLGERFLRGDPFGQGGGGEWYLVGRSMLDALPALLPYRVSRAVVLLVGVGCLAIALHLLRRMADAAAGKPLDRETAFAATTLTLAILVPHLARDFQECGLHLILMALLVVAGHALWRGWSLRAGFWLALAVTWKTTPILFLPVLVWKRRWQAALWMVVFGVALNLLPAFHLGWERTVQSHLLSYRFMQRVAQLEDIAENGVEPPNIKNQGLMAACARYLQSYPPGHNLHQDDPAFVQFADLDHRTAGLAARGILLLLAAFVAWRMWGRWETHDSRLPGEWATTMAFCALLSPLCWRQHLVLALPVMFLVVHRLFVHGAARPWGWCLLPLAGLLIWLPQRELMGKSLAYTLMSYKPDTFVVLGACLAALYFSPVAILAAGPEQHPEEDRSSIEKRLAA
jgi:hypothetical protein